MYQIWQQDFEEHLFVHHLINVFCPLQLKLQSFDHKTKHLNITLLNILLFVYNDM